MANQVAKSCEQYRNMYWCRWMENRVAKSCERCCIIYRRRWMVNQVAKSCEQYRKIYWCRWMENQGTKPREQHHKITIVAIYLSVSSLGVCYQRTTIYGRLHWWWDKTALALYLGPIWLIVKWQLLQVSVSFLSSDKVTKNAFIYFKLVIVNYFHAISRFRNYINLFGQHQQHKVRIVDYSKRAVCGILAITPALKQIKLVLRWMFVYFIAAKSVFGILSRHGIHIR